MKKNNIYHYYVEGENEEKAVKVLKTEFQWIQPGKTEKFNVIERELTKNRIIKLKQGTIVVLVFDTDTDSCEILNKNIEFLKNQKQIGNVICITQVKNLEDEFIRSCSIKEIKELTGSKSNREFKKDMLHSSNFKKKLLEKDFDFTKFWSLQANSVFENIRNDAGRIKKLDTCRE